MKYWSNLYRIYTKKLNFFSISEGLLTTLRFLIWVKRGTKYDTCDNVCDFPMKELNVLIRHYVTHRCFTDFLRFADLMRGGMARSTAPL